MAWEDRTPFEAIERQFGLSEPKVITLMRAELKRSSFNLWRARITGRNTKHVTRRPAEMKDCGRHTACFGQPARPR